MYFLYRSGIFADDSSDDGQPDGAAFEFVDNGIQDLVVHLVQSAFVDDLFIDDAVTFDLGEIPNAAQQGVGDSGVPRLRRAISLAPSSVTGMFMIWQLRLMTLIGVGVL